MISAMTGLIISKYIPQTSSEVSALQTTFWATTARIQN